MSKIVVSYNGLVQQEVAIDKPRLSIGRRQSNDLVIDHLTVSGQHAAIDTTNQGSFVLDLGSTNGTMVNGQPIKKHLLQNEDVIEIGRYKLHFKLEAVAAQPGGRAKSAAPAAVASKAAPAGMLKVLSGSNAGKELQLNKPVTTLGKPGVLVIAVTRVDSGYAISQVEGETAATVNDKPILAPSQPLNQGDVVAMAGTKMIFSTEP